jgi:hypothetical protein
MTPTPPSIDVKLLGTPHTATVAQRDFVEIAPGEFMAQAPVRFAPKVGVVKFVRVEANLYQPVIQALPLLVTRAAWREDLYGCGWKTAQSLAFAGFVEYRRPAPGKMSLVVESWLDHLNASNDPNFWTLERRRALAEARSVLTRMKSAGEEDVEDDEEEAEKQTELF